MALFIFKKALFHERQEGKLSFWKRICRKSIDIFKGTLHYKIGMRQMQRNNRWIQKQTRIFNQYQYIL